MILADVDPGRGEVGVFKMQQRSKKNSKMAMVAVSPNTNMTIEQINRQLP